ncbi:MAG: hypothetical protein JSR80_00230 [Verrucomicrobia bacterium]|nr:hypothetical protein [Verrucomicrobiota bacterium]
MRTFLLSLLVLFLPLVADVTLINQLQRAKAGDFLVTLQGRTYTLLLIKEFQGNSLVIEEISFPKQKGGRIDFSWKTWVEQGAPGHTSWIRSEIESATGQIQSCYSYSERKWLSTTCDSFLPTLLSLHFQQVSDSQRAKTGSGHLWQPPLSFQGKQRRDLPFNAYVGRWPCDNSLLSGRLLTIYLPAQEGPYPDYFPYWIDVQDYKIRVVDTGSGLLSSS